MTLESARSDVLDRMRLFDDEEDVAAVRALIYAVREDERRLILAAARELAAGCQAIESEGGMTDQPAEFPWQSDAWEINRLAEGRSAAEDVLIEWVQFDPDNEASRVILSDAMHGLQMWLDSLPPMPMLMAPGAADWGVVAQHVMD